MLKGFQQFILRGNVLDLAVAVVMGAAFGGVVTALVKDLLTPLIAAIFGQPDITSVGSFTINGANFSIGAVLQAVLNFLFVAIAVYFVLVLPMNRLMQLRKRGEEEPPEAPSEEVMLLTQIRDLLGGADTTVAGPPTGDPTPGGPTTGGPAYPPGPTSR